MSLCFCVLSLKTTQPLMGILLLFPSGVATANQLSLSKPVFCILLSNTSYVCVSCTHLNTHIHKNHIVSFCSSFTFFFSLLHHSFICSVMNFLWNPSIFHSCFFLCEVTGSLEPIPATSGQKQGTPKTVLFFEILLFSILSPNDQMVYHETKHHWTFNLIKNQSSTFSRRCLHVFPKLKCLLQLCLGLRARRDRTVFYSLLEADM